MSNQNIGDRVTDELLAQGGPVAGFIAAGRAIREAAEEFGRSVDAAFQNLAMDLDDERRGLRSARSRSDAVALAEEIQKLVDSALIDGHCDALLREQLSRLLTARKGYSGPRLAGGA